MTWRQLIAALQARIPPEQLEEEAVYREPYDDFEVLPVAVCVCTEPLVSAGGVQIAPGQFLLC